MAKFGKEGPEFKEKFGKSGGGKQVKFGGGKDKAKKSPKRHK